MSDFFDKAVEAVLEHEGGYTNNINDNGGATAYGISLRFLKDYTNINPKEFYMFDIDSDGDIDAADIQGLTLEGVKYLYKKEFWNKYNYDRITNYLVARKVFDLSVNMGGAQANKLLQRAVRAANGVVLDDDGILGPKSFAQINNADAPALLAALRSEAAGFYRGLIRADSKLKDFEKGWMCRAYY